MGSSSNTLESRLRQALGDANLMAGAKVPASPWKTGQPFRGRFLLLPDSVERVSAVLSLCNESRQPVVPIGGMTNLVQACATTADDVGLTLDHMAAIDEVDAGAHTMTVQAGATLAAAQAAAEAEGLFFPVDIGSRDNCTIGGNVATNAGGTKVIRYGMMRDSVLGLEAVLANGTVISSMNRYLKNNSGFDLKQLFIGSEGTLGVITRLVIRLRVEPVSHHVALLAARSFADTLAILEHVRRRLGAGLCGFEVMWRNFYERATEPRGPQRSPVDSGYPFYIIVESMGSHAESDDRAFADAMEELFAASRVADGVVAQSGRERDAIWAIRHEVEWLVSEAHNFDVSLRAADAEQYVNDVSERIERHIPDAFVAAFGHLGDNNVHISVLADGTNSREVVEREIYTTLTPYSGAISAEHGIGVEKRRYLPISRSAEEIALMKSLKTLLDPNNILNPGKVIDVGAQSA